MESWGIGCGVLVSLGFVCWGVHFWNVGAFGWALMPGDPPGLGSWGAGFPVFGGFVVFGVLALAVSGSLGVGVGLEHWNLGS